MVYEFTVYDILSDKLNEIKIDLFESKLFKKTAILLDIWATQKKLGYFFDKYQRIEQEKKEFITEKKEEENCTDVLNYKEQYIKFLMKNNLIFIIEQKNNNILLNLIYYYLLADVKKDKQLLDNF